MQNKLKQLDDNIANPKLSICIATYNRGNFITDTLDSILNQMLPSVELIVVDGASPDNTPEIMKKYITKHPEVRYFREQENSGIEGDYDKAVNYAKGDYCWLMSDDDLVKQGSIDCVLSKIKLKKDLIVANTEIWNSDFSSLLLDRRLSINSDIEFKNNDYEEFFIKTANQLGFIGCVIIRRDVWLSRDRVSYYGTMFVHVGVIFQHPPIDSALVIAKPLLALRDGNATWAARTFEIWAIKWPELIWSFKDFSDSSKKEVCQFEQWRKFKFLFYHRAMGSYSLAEYQNFLSHKTKSLAKIKAYTTAIFPGKAANLIVVLYYVLFKRSSTLELFDVLCSRYESKLSKYVAHKLGHNFPKQK